MSVRVFLSRFMYDAILMGSYDMISISVITENI